MREGGKREIRKRERKEKSEERIATRHSHITPPHPTL